MKRMKQKMDEQRNFFSRNRLSVNYICGQFGRKSVDVTGSPATMLVNVSLPAGRRGGGGAKIAASYRVSIFSRGRLGERHAKKEETKNVYGGGKQCRSTSEYHKWKFLIYWQYSNVYEIEVFAKTEQKKICTQKKLSEKNRDTYE